MSATNSHGRSLLVSLTAKELRILVFVLES